VVSNRKGSDRHLTTAKAEVLVDIYQQNGTIQ